MIVWVENKQKLISDWVYLKKKKNKQFLLAHFGGKLRCHDEYSFIATSAA